ncbi:unnamed protein product (macronuclear) [Paramecium tetraurelia]|uniref:Cilia- and flagella-associated protein 57 n=1 Tax=Paramecium tetraurelia TaxID=5888 RepID=A0DJK3_PARTE|nr:uncharacterized protein GSPATT00017564001 [Paramecium tetraurelia]CAK83220.1 unnamed protein product [Paramecium tetraurelia]|eukprot:XP_001450617.1 hypothetical protein (macronuclear) [Paramecium tetraurelia strain d4-2]
MNTYEDEKNRIALKNIIDERNKKIVKTPLPQFYLDQVCGIADRPISNQLTFIQGNLIVFYASNMIIVQNVETGQQQFIPGRYKNVTAIAAAMRKDGLMIAVGENLEQSSNLVIIIKDKIRTISLQCKGAISLIQLNVEKQYCGLQISNQIQIWNYEKERLLASAVVKAPFEKFSFHPLKHKHILLSGHNYLRLWEMQFQEKQIKETHETLIPLKIEKENKFLDHGWVMLSANQALLVLLAAGNKILILINDHFKKPIDIDPQNLNFIDAPVQDFNAEDNDDVMGINSALEDAIKDKVGQIVMNNQTKLTQNTTIMTQQQLEFQCLSTTKKGFILGGTKGAVCIYEFDKNYNIVSAMSFNMKSNRGEHKVIQISNSGDQLISIISLFGNQLYYSILNTAQMDTEVSPIQPFFAAGFHNKRVNSISHAKIKQVFVTCSEDNSVKIWNYYQNENNDKKGVLSKYFKEEPVCASMHPFGLFVAVGFTNGFKVFAILNEGFFPLKDVTLNNCKIVKYSHGGHMLITNEKTNVYIYDAIYYELIHQFEFHNSPIKDIAISLNDQYIVSTCTSGYVYCYNLAELNNNVIREQKHQEQGIFNSIQYDEYFIGCTNEKLMVIFDQHFKLITEFHVTDCYLTKLLMTDQHIIAGTSKGTVRIYPIRDEDNLELELINQKNETMYKLPECYEISVHATAITCIDYDGQYIFTGCEDGSVCLLKSKSEISEERQRMAAVSNDLYLEVIFKIQKENDRIQSKNFEVIKSEQTVRIETAKLETQFKQKIDQMTKKFQQTMSDDKNLKDKFVEKSEQDYDQLYSQYMEEKVKYENEINKLKQQHIEKIEYEESRNQEIEDEIQKVQEQHKNDLQSLLEQHKQELKQMKLQFYEKCRKVQVKYSSVVDNAKNYGTAFIQRLEKEEAEYEKEIDEQIKDLENQIAKVIQDNEKLEKENRELASQFEQLKKDDDDLQIQFNELFDEHNKIRLENLKNDDDILKMQHQLLERLQVIDSKEETCKAAKDEQINLENFRYMLDQKIKSLQNDKQLLLDKITDKEYKLRVMFKELIDESNKNEMKYQQLVQLRGQLDVIETQIKKTEIQIFLNANKLKNYESTLLSIMKSNDPPSLIAQKLRQIINDKGEENEEIEQLSQKKSISNKDIKDIIKLKQDKPNELNEELLRQGQWMTKKLYLIKVTSDKLKKIRDDNINTIFNQNTKLIEECNMLRSENDRYSKKIKHVEKLVKDADRLLQRLKPKLNKQPKLNQIEKQIEEQKQKVQNQKTKLSNLKDSMSQILKKSVVD